MLEISFCYKNGDIRKNNGDICKNNGDISKKDGDICKNKGDRKRPYIVYIKMEDFRSP